MANLITKSCLNSRFKTVPGGSVRFGSGWLGPRAKIKLTQPSKAGVWAELGNKPDGNI